MTVAFTPVTHRLAEGLPRRDTLARADAIVVLASRLQADGEPTPSAQSRLLYGVELLSGGWAPRLVVTEQAEPAARSASVARALVSSLGSSGEVMSVGPVARTRDEAMAVATLYREEGWGRLLVVTSPLHSRRACAALERAGAVATCAPAPETRYDLETLDRPAERLQAFADLLYERIALWYYARRSWI